MVQEEWIIEVRLKFMKGNGLMGKDMAMENNIFKMVIKYNLKILFIYKSDKNKLFLGDYYNG